MRIETWLVGQELAQHEQWSITVYGDIEALIKVLDDYPADLILHRGAGCAYVHFGRDTDVSKASNSLWEFISKLNKNIVRKMAGWHNASHITIGGY